MSTKLTIVVALFFIILAAGIVLIVVPAPRTAQAPIVSDNTVATSSPISDLIVVDSPKPGDTLSSTTITITGKARGNWYFEASFPVVLKDNAGNTLAQGPAQAQGDWMTTNFVPFSATISFPTQPAGSKGTLVLKNDNPSGDPSKDKQLEIPVVFK